jgi:hypothetical protein
MSARFVVVQFSQIPSELGFILHQEYSQNRSSVSSIAAIAAAFFTTTAALLDNFLAARPAAFATAIARKIGLALFSVQASPRHSFLCSDS